MKQLFTLALFALTSATVFGQLYVQPTTNSASYVYVEDTFVFVKGDVNLNKNDAGSVPAVDRVTPSIMLRQGAQFLQGDNIPSARNSGNGFLSVFQEGTADAFNYNFWASPIGISEDDTGLVRPIGNTVFQVRNTTFDENTNLFNPNNVFDSNAAFIIPPNGGYNGTVGGMAQLRIASYWLFKKPHGENYGSWLTVQNSGFVEPGFGFTMKGVDGNDGNDPGEGSANNDGGAMGNAFAQGQRYDFRGRPNTGTIDIEVLPNDEILIGNPYPSAFDLSYFLMNNSGTSTFDYDDDGDSVQTTFTPQDILTGTAHFWEYNPLIRSHTLTEYEGGYGTFTPVDPETVGMYMPATFATYNEAGEIENPGSGDSGLTINRRFSPIGQGFFIYASSAVTASTNLVVDNRYRIFRREGNDSDFKSSNSNERVYSDVPQLRINVSVNDTYSRQLGMAFVPQATLNYDPAKDGKNVSMIATDVFFVIDGEDNFVLNAHNYNRENMLPLTFKVAEQSLLKIAFGSQIDFPGDEVYLYDDERQEFHDILNGEVRYMLDEGVYENRFFITFKNRNDEEETEDEETDDGTLSLEDSVLESFDIFQNNPSGQLEIQNPKNVVLNTVSLYDIAGKQIFNRTNLGSEQTYTFPTGNLSDAIYIVRIVTQEGLTKARKISVFNK